jgi:hypothetical protein
VECRGQDAKKWSAADLPVQASFDNAEYPGRRPNTLYHVMGAVAVRDPVISNASHALYLHFAAELESYLARRLSWIVMR